MTQYYYTISIVNGIGIYNYIDSKYQNNLSKWNEANFYEKYFVGQKLNVVNTNLNDGRYTILNTDLTDPVSFEYYASALPAGKDLIIEFLSKTDLPRIYEGSLLITEDGRIKLDEVVPDIIKPGTSFRLFGTNQNTGDLTVADVPKFEALAKETYFASASQVLYNNLL